MQKEYYTTVKMIIFESIYEVQQYQVFCLIVLSPLGFITEIVKIAEKISYYLNFEVFDQMFVNSTEGIEDFDCGVYSIFRGSKAYALQKYILFLGLYILGLMVIPVLRLLIGKVKLNNQAKYEIEKELILMRISKIEVELEKDDGMNMQDTSKKEDLKLYASNSKLFVKDLKLQEIQESNCLISAYSYFQFNYFIRLFQIFHNKLAVVALSTLIVSSFEDTLSSVLSLIVLLVYYFATFAMIIYLNFKKTDLYLMEFIKSVGAVYLGCSTIHKSTYSIYLIFFQNFVCLSLIFLWNYGNFMMACLICIYVLKICFISFATPFYKANKVLFESISEIMILILLLLTCLARAYPTFKDNEGFKIGNIVIFCVVVVIRFIRFLFDFYFKLKELQRAKVLEINPFLRISKVVLDLEAEISKVGQFDEKTTDRIKFQKPSLFL